MRTYSFKTSKTLFLTISLAALAAAPAYAHNKQVCVPEVAAANQTPPQPQPVEISPGTFVCANQITQWTNARCVRSNDPKNGCKLIEKEEPVHMEKWFFKLVTDPVIAPSCVPQTVDGRTHAPDPDSTMIVMVCNEGSTIK
jgi:hypothetical protein